MMHIQTLILGNKVLIRDLTLRKASCYQHV
jgi:hypothetical protein